MTRRRVCTSVWRLLLREIWAGEDGLSGGRDAEQSLAVKRGEALLPIRVSLVDFVNKAVRSGKTGPYLDHDTGPFRRRPRVETEPRRRAPVNGRKLTSGVSQPISLLFLVFHSGAVGSKGMKSYPEPRAR